MKRSSITGGSLCLLALFTTLPMSAADRVFEDEDFAPENWTFHVLPTGWGGTATNFHRANDGWLDAHLETRITVYAPSTNLGSVVHTVSLNDRARHDPAVEGEIFAINYQEQARVFLLQFPDLLRPNGWQRVALALRQDGVLYTAPEPRLFIESTNWIAMEQPYLRAEDFIQVPSGIAKPDFTTNGTEIVFGFFRANSTPAGSYPNSTPGTPVFTSVGGLDNWRVELLLTDPGVTNKLPRAGRRVETYALNREHAARNIPDREAREEKFEPAPVPDVTQYLTSATNVQGLVNAPDFIAANADARIGVFAGVRARAQGGIMIDHLQPHLRLARATTRDIRQFVATAPPGTTEAQIDLWMIADGFFDFSPAINNPWEPYYDQLSASAEQSVVLHRESQTRTIMRGAARVHRVPGNPAIRITAEDAWQGYVTFQPAGNLAYNRPTLDYSEIMLNIATVPVGESFAVEFRLHAESRAGDEAADWWVVADFYNTAGYTVQSSTPGVQIIEITPVQERPPLNLRRAGSELRLEWDVAGFMLQSAPAVGGPWTDLTDAVSPHLLAPTGAVDFFRLKKIQ
jgi:hypothetical protein